MLRGHAQPCSHSARLCLPSVSAGSRSAQSPFPPPPHHVSSSRLISAPQRERTQSRISLSKHPAHSGSRPMVSTAPSAESLAPTSTPSMADCRATASSGESRLPFHATAAAGSTARATSVPLRRFRGGRLLRAQGPRLRTTAVVWWSPRKRPSSRSPRSLQWAGSGACVAVPTATQARLTPADASPRRHSPPWAEEEEVPCLRRRHCAGRGPAVDQVVLVALLGDWWYEMRRSAVVQARCGRPADMCSGETQWRLAVQRVKLWARKDTVTRYPTLIDIGHFPDLADLHGTVDGTLKNYLPMASRY